MKRIINIENGKGLLKLKWNGSLSSLQFNDPISLHWFDCMGSLGKFFVILPYNKDYREEIQKRFSKSLNEGLEIDEEMFNTLTEVLDLFENATYELFYEPKYRYKIDDSWNWVYIGNERDSSTNPEKYNTINSQTSDDLSKIYSVTESFYDGYNESLLFTQPLEIINQERVKYYEEIIKNGFKPTAIIYYGLLEESGVYDDGSKWKSTNRSGLYILDGHHKLMAYKNLNQEPSLLRIIKRYNSKSDFNLTKQEFENEIRQRLFKPQIRHITENCRLKYAT
jgi:hypothetical protein